MRIFCPVVYYLVLGAFKNVTLKLKGQLQITSALHYRILPYCQSSRLNTHSARKVNAFCKQASKKVASPSLRPLIDTCQNSTSPANHEPRSPANGSFQNPGVCPQAVPSFPSPTPTVLFLALAPFSAQAKYRKLRPFLGLSLLPNSTETLATQATRGRLVSLAGM